MRISRILFLVCLLFVARWAAAFQNSGNSYSEKSSTLTSAESELYSLVNEERKSRNLPLFAIDDQLTNAARKHTWELARMGKLSHQFPDEPDLKTRLAQAGGKFDAVAENVAESDSVQNAHIELMHSPGHRANLLNPAYNAIGIGIVEKGEQIYVTEDFSHRVPEQTRENIESQIFKQVNHVRSQSGLPALQRVESSALRQAACKSDISASAAKTYLPGPGSIVVFTQSDTNNLPIVLKKGAGDPLDKNIAIGVCYPPAAQQGFAMFTAIVALYR
ncbi:MAG TPA: CAP domain-containing protein [Candidatus Angelobacter sp.]|nr:CAP domain-containing protein [Candidatus Angelobacter sp.]